MLCKLRNRVKRDLFQSIKTLTRVCVLKSFPTCLSYRLIPFSLSGVSKRQRARSVEAERRGRER